MALSDPERSRAYSAEYRRKNQEKIAAAKAEWRQRNKDSIAAYRAAYDQRNREHVLAQKRDAEQRRRTRLKAEQDQKNKAVQRAKKHAAANPEKTAQTKRDWEANNPDKMKKARADYRERNRAAVQQRSDAWRNANPDRVAGFTANPRRDPDALAEYTRQRRADPAKYAHDLELSRDRRRLIRQLTSKGLPPPRQQKVTAAQRRANGAVAREFFTRARTAIEHLDLIQKEDAPPTAQELQNAARDRQNLRNREEIQKHTSHYLARHAERIRREIELDSRARQIRGAPPLNIDLELVKRVRTFTDSDNKPALSGQPGRDPRTPAARIKNPPTRSRQRDTDRSR